MRYRGREVGRYRYLFIGGEEGGWVKFSWMRLGVSRVGIIASTFWGSWDGQIRFRSC